MSKNPSVKTSKCFAMEHALLLRSNSMKSNFFDFLKIHLKKSKTDFKILL